MTANERKTNQRDAKSVPSPRRTAYTGKHHPKALDGGGGDDEYPLRDLDDPDIGVWDYIPGEVWRETEFLAAALIRHDYEALADHNFPLTDAMIDEILAHLPTEQEPVTVAPVVISAHAAGWLRCLRCDTWKAPTAFGVDKRKRSGRKSWCKICLRDAERTRWHRTKTLRPTPAPRRPRKLRNL